MKKIALVIIAGLIAVSLFNCGKSQPKREEQRKETETAVTDVKQETVQNTEAQKDVEPESEDEQETAPEEQYEEEADEEPEDALEEDGISPEFKEAMDSYEAFFDEYVEFMKTYADSDNPTALLMEYAEYMEKYADAMEKLDKLEEEDLTPAEEAYYIAAMARIQQKLLEVQ